MAILGVGPDYRGKKAAPAKQILTKLPRIETLMAHHHIQGKTLMKRVKWPVVVPELQEQAMALQQESMFDQVSDNKLVLSEISVATSKTFKCQKKIKYRHELACNSLLKKLK